MTHLNRLAANSMNDRSLGDLGRERQEDASVGLSALGSERRLYRDHLAVVNVS